MRFAAIVASYCVWLASLGAAPPSFSYDAFAPLEYQVDATSTDAGLQTSHVSFRSGAALIRAVLIAPERPDPAMPAVLFVHGSGDARASDRREFLPDAEWLGRRGVVSLLPEEPWSRSDWRAARASASPATDPVAIVVALRRCLDVLEKAPGVDPKRLAYVGHDLGATYGALLAAVDTRPAWFVFMAPAGEAPLPGAPVLDAPAALERATFSGSLAQFAKRDDALPAAAAAAFATALPAGDRTIDTYDASHALAVDAASDDRRLWLGRRLGLSAL